MARTTEQLRRLWAPACDMPRTTVEFWTGAKLHVHEAAGEAFQALADWTHHHGYVVRPEDTGAYNCRRITGGTGYSLHAYGIAGDLNWQSNPYARQLVTDMPPAMVADIVGIRTKGGARVFVWGGDWDGDPNTRHSVYDAMHYQVCASPAELAQGLDPSTLAPSGDRPPAPEQPPAAPIPAPGGVTTVTVNLNLPVLRMGDKGKAVRALQDRLRDDCAQRIAVDGAWGPQTDKAVRNVQAFMGLTVDGIVGERTWGAIALAAFPII